MSGEIDQQLTQALLSAITDEYNQDNKQTLSYNDND